MLDQVQKKRGRPLTGFSMSNAEKQRLYRQRKKLSLSSPVQNTISLDKLSEILQLEKQRFETLYHQSMTDDSKVKNMASLNALVLFEMVLGNHGYNLGNALPK